MDVKRYSYPGMTIQVFDPPQPDPGGKRMVEFPLIGCVADVDEEGRNIRKPVQIGVTYSFPGFSVTRYGS